MSKLNIYAKELERLTREAVNKMRSAEEREKRAREALDEYPDRGNYNKEAYNLERQKRVLELKEASEELKEAKRSIPEKLESSIRGLRARLEQASEQYFAIDPKSLNPEVVSILDKSFITAKDLSKLMRSAEEDNNISMIRVISDQASQRAKSEERASEKMELLAIADRASNYSPRVYLESFDALSTIANRCALNTRLIDSWDSIGITKSIEEF